MYHFSYHKEEDKAVLLAFMRQHPFVLLCGTDAAGEPVATHVPVLITERNGELFLRGHLMRKTDHHKAFEANPVALAVFNGPHTYVSASWYSNPAMGSTWNYITVHAKGPMHFLPQEELLQILDELTARFENNPASPSLYRHLSQEYIQHMAKAIVGFEIAVSELANVYKLSQNRDQASFENIIAHLQQQGGDAALIAQEMELRKAKLFS